MKKKLLILSIVAALVAIAVVGGSLAYFTDTSDAVTNTFTIGSIDIEQKETNADGSDFTQNQMLLPVVNTATPSADANYIDKQVTVESTGKNDAYVRTFIAVPESIHAILHLDVDTTRGWVDSGNLVTTRQGVAYHVYMYTYTNPLKKDDANTPENEAVTSMLLKGVYLDSAVDIKEDKDDNNTKKLCTKKADGTYQFYAFDITKAPDVLVATQGVQAEGFSDATAALNGAFGVFSEQNNPFFKATTNP